MTTIIRMKQPSRHGRVAVTRLVVKGWQIWCKQVGGRHNSCDLATLSLVHQSVTISVGRVQSVVQAILDPVLSVKNNKFWRFPSDTCCIIMSGLMVRLMEPC